MLAALSIPAHLGYLALAGLIAAGSMGLPVRGETALLAEGYWPISSNWPSLSSSPSPRARPSSATTWAMRSDAEAGDGSSSDPGRCTHSDSGCSSAVRRSSRGTALPHRAHRRPSAPGAPGVPGEVPARHPREGRAVLRQARTQGRVSGTLDSGPAHRRRLAGRHQPHSLARLPVLERAGRHPLGHLGRPARLLPRSDRGASVQDGGHRRRRRCRAIRRCLPGLAPLSPPGVEPTPS